MFDPLLPGLAAHRRVTSVDLPDHGESPARDEVTSGDVVDALVATIDALGIDAVVPVGLSHAGWAALELRRRLGPDRVPGVVLLDWMVLGTPPGFAAALAGLQVTRRGPTSAPASAAMWTDGLDVPALSAYVAAMGDVRRAALAACRPRDRRGLRVRTRCRSLALSRPSEPCPTLHLYAQPAADEVLAAQQEYAATHPWFSVHRLDARSHFPMFEVPDEMVAAIEAFVVLAAVSVTPPSSWSSWPTPTTRRSAAARC